MWTGAMGRTVRGDSNFPSGCYIDTTGGTYTSFSHGLLSAQFKYNMGHSQIIQSNIGIDAEQVRNVMQNKLIHDVAILPKSWFKRNNCHIPMLDDKGEQYLFKPGQKIKNPTLIGIFLPILICFISGGFFRRRFQLFVINMPFTIPLRLLFQIICKRLFKINSRLVCNAN